MKMTLVLNRKAGEGVVLADPIDAKVAAGTAKMAECSTLAALFNDVYNPEDGDELEVLEIEVP
jgi:hypothetical protein